MRVTLADRIIQLSTFIPTSLLLLLLVYPGIISFTFFFKEKDANSFQIIT